MITGLQVVLMAGGLVGLGVTLLIARIVPAEPDLADVLGRLAPTRQRTASSTASATRRERLGLWAMRSLPSSLWIRTPHRDLALLQVPLARYYGDKLAFAAFGLTAPPLFALLCEMVGLTLPIVVPAIASLGLAAVLFFVPNHNAADDARRARTEFSRALSAYIELVALERIGGAGTRQAMEEAAKVGRSWVFVRIAERLRQASLSGVPPWDALHTLSEELGLPELDDFADIMRLSGEDGATVYAILRARAAALRSALLNDDLGEANAVGERMSIPSSLLAVIFLGILITPPVLRLLNGE